MKDGGFWKSLPQRQWGQPLSVFLWWRWVRVWGMQQMSVCCSSTRGSVTTGLCPILLFFILIPYSHKSNSASTPEVPSGELPALLIQSRVTTVLQLWQTGVARRFSSLRKLGKGKWFACIHLFGSEKWGGRGVGSSQLYCINIWNRAPHK